MSNGSQDYILLSFKILNSSLFPFFFFFPDPPFRMIFLTVYSYWDCILTFHWDGHWSFLGYLSHRYFAGGGRVECRLWGHCSGVILPLMRQIKLVQCIKCESDKCIIWKLPPLIAYTSLLPSSAFSPMALVVCLKSPEECMLLGLLKQAVFLDFTILIILTMLGTS